MNYTAHRGDLLSSNLSTWAVHWRPYLPISSTISQSHCNISQCTLQSDCDVYRYKVSTQMGTRIAMLSSRWTHFPAAANSRHAVFDQVSLFHCACVLLTHWPEKSHSCAVLYCSTLLKYTSNYSFQTPTTIQWCSNSFGMDMGQHEDNTKLMQM
jgi:hypothetical protein